MRHAFLIARREYLAYVSTWGFWLSLALIPVVMSAGFFIPLLIEQATPTKYYAVVDESGLGVIDAIDQREADRERRRLREMIEAISGLEDDAVRDQALDAFDAETDLQAARAAALEALPERVSDALDQADAVSDARRARVRAPADTIEELRPYLLGDAEVETPEGPRPLAAAIIARVADDGGLALEYWSSNLNERSISNFVEAAAADAQRTAALKAARVDPALVDTINALEPELLRLTPERTGGDAEVTLADRLPLLIGAIAAFMLWFMIFAVAATLLNSTVEERNSKVMEVLLTMAGLRDILIGKLGGVAAVSFTVGGVWVLVAGSLAVIGLSYAPQLDWLPDVVNAIADPGLWLGFAFYFFCGYLMYGSIFCAAGSMCETLQESQTLMTPVIYLMMLPLLALPIAIEDPEAPFLAILSWIPIYTPFVMPVRLPTDPGWIVILGTSVLMVATTLAALWGAERLFNAGAVQGATMESAKKAAMAVFKRGPAAAKA